MVCVHNSPTIIVPMNPTRRPAWLNAIGMAKIPVPIELLRMCIRAPENLQDHDQTIETILWNYDK